MADNGTLAKCELARLLHVTPGRVWGLAKLGMPVRADGRVNREEAVDWIAKNIRGMAGRLGNR